LGKFLSASREKLKGLHSTEFSEFLWPPLTNTRLPWFNPYKKVVFLVHTMKAHAKAEV